MCSSVPSGYLGSGEVTQLSGQTDKQKMDRKLGKIALNSLSRIEKKELSMLHMRVEHVLAKKAP